MSETKEGKEEKGQGSLSQAVGSPVTVTLRGKEITLHPLTVNDLAAFEGFLRSQRLQDALSAIEATKEADSPALERIRLIAEMSRVPLDNLTIQENMTSVSGMQFLLWRSMLRGNPRMTLDQVGAMVDLDNLDTVMQVLNSLSGEEVPEGENPPKAGSDSPGI